MLAFYLPEKLNTATAVFSLYHGAGEPAGGWRCSKDGSGGSHNSRYMSKTCTGLDT